MVKKPTYEELQQMVKALERELAKQRQFAEKLQKDCTYLKQLVDQRTVELKKKTPERMQAEKELEELKDNFYLLFGTTGDIIWEVDRNSVYTYVSPQVKDLLGYGPEEMVGKPVFDFMSPDEAKRVVELNKRAIESQKEFIMFEFAIVHKDGYLVLLETNAVPIFGENGDYQGYRGIDRDITSRKKMEEALRISNEKFSAIFRSSPNAIAISTLEDRRIIEANERFFQLSEYSREEAIGHTFYELNLWATPEEQERFKSLLWENGEVHNFEYTFQKKKSGTGIGLLSASLFSFEDEVCHVSILNDITERKRAEEALQKAHDELELRVAGRTAELTKSNEQLKKQIIERKQAEDALRQSEEKYKALFENAGDALFFLEVDPKNRSWFIECNKRTLGLFGCEHADIMGKTPAFVSPEIQPDGESSVKKAMGLTRLVMDGKPQDFQWLHQRHDNKETFWVEVNLTQLTLAGKSNYMQAVVRDITDRKQAEDLVLDLSRQLIETQENERQMIAYELHDSVAQDLSSSRITCEMLLKYKSLTPGARKQISVLSRNLHKTLISVRDLSYDLRPPGLEKLGLPRVMYQFCEDYSERTGVQVDFQSAGINELNLNYSTKINLYRLLQEGLNNVKKHADADNVKVRLVSSFPNVILRIYDNGKGFDLKEHLTKTSSEKKMGLSSMAHRVDLLLGRLEIESIPGKGTKIFIEIPYHETR